MDVLAHTFPAGADWDRTLPDRMRAANMALTPTLKLWSWEPGAGLVAVGSPGDLVVLDDDPARDVRALARVRYTMRGGRLIYESGK